MINNSERVTSILIGWNKMSHSFVRRRGNLWLNDNDESVIYDNNNATWHINFICYDPYGIMTTKKSYLGLYEKEIYIILITNYDEFAAYFDTNTSTGIQDDTTKAYIDVIRLLIVDLFISNKGCVLKIEDTRISHAILQNILDVRDKRDHFIGDVESYVATANTIIQTYYFWELFKCGVQ